MKQTNNLQCAALCECVDDVQHQVVTMLPVANADCNTDGEADSDVQRVML